MKDEHQRNLRDFALRVFIIVVAAPAVILGVIILYQFSWSGFGQTTRPDDLTELPKTIWDWLDLLVVPLIILIATVAFNGSMQNAQERRENLRQAHEKQLEALRANRELFDSLLDRISKLLLDQGLNEKGENNDEMARWIATAHVTSALNLLDTQWKTETVLFLVRAKLLNGENPTIKLEWVNLDDMELAGQTLNDVNFERTLLRHSNFELTKLQGAFFTGAQLSGSKFHFAEMNKANLSGANLTDASLQNAKLEDAIFDEKTFLPDGTRWNAKVDMRRFTDSDQKDFWQPDWTRNGK